MYLLSAILSPWPWYVSGPLIACVMFLLLWVGGEFGVSSTLRTICSACGAGKKISFFEFDWKNQLWNIVFVLGAVVGGFVAANFLSYDELGSGVSQATVEDLRLLGVSYQNNLLPTELISFSALQSWKGWVAMVGGGFLVGFGSRWAGGCTSGHAISGLANLQLPSLIAVIGFFIGGLLMVHVIYPLIF